MLVEVKLKKICFVLSAKRSLGNLKNARVMTAQRFFVNFASNLSQKLLMIVVPDVRLKKILNLLAKLTESFLIKLNLSVSESNVDKYFAIVTLPIT